MASNQIRFDFVAIFIPIVLRVAARTDLNASRMLLPMSYASLITGMGTG
jgi:hypothetical protein